MSRAPDPSDIIWENIGTKKRSFVLRFILTCILLVGVVVSVTFVIFTSTVNNTKAFEYETKLPNVDCADITILYGDNLANMALAEYQY